MAPLALGPYRPLSLSDCPWHAILSFGLSIGGLLSLISFPIKPSEPFCFQFMLHCVCLCYEMGYGRWISRETPDSRPSSGTILGFLLACL